MANLKLCFELALLCVLAIGIPYHALASLVPALRVRVRRIRVVERLGIPPFEMELGVLKRALFCWSVRVTLNAVLCVACCCFWLKRDGGLDEVSDFVGEQLVELLAA